MNMKKLILSISILVIALIVNAQTVQENELAVVYYMPQTQLAVTVEYDEITVKPGPFYLYAERYLGVGNVVTEAQTRYALTQIQVKPHTVPDYNRPYKMVADGSNELQLLSLTPEGLLYGYNVSPYLATVLESKNETATIESATKLMPLLEEQMVASSIAKMAEGAAKQIYHIREMRINLLVGDVEHTPADGQAMQLVLDELEKREQQLAELFVGTRTVKHLSHTIYYVPSKDVTDRIIGRFSQFNGIVAANDLSGEPIRLTLTGKYQSYIPTDRYAKQKSKDAVPSQLYYNLPGSAHVKVSFGEEYKISATLSVAQFGVAIPIAKSLLIQHTPHIYFNTQTGNILTIEQ